MEAPRSPARKPAHGDLERRLQRLSLGPVAESLEEGQIVESDVSDVSFHYALHCHSTITASPASCRSDEGYATPSPSLGPAENINYASPGQHSGPPHAHSRALSELEEGEIDERTSLALALSPIPVLSFSSPLKAKPEEVIAASFTNDDLRAKRIPARSTENKENLNAQDMSNASRDFDQASAKRPISTDGPETPDLLSIAPTSPETPPRPALHVATPLLPSEAIPAPKPIPKGSAASLLATFARMVSPSSQPKYNEKDLQRNLGSLEEKHQGELERLQKEISSWSSKHEAVLEQSQKLQSILGEYEQAMKKMIADGQKIKEDDRATIDALTKSKASIELELRAVEVAFRDLKGKYSDMKIINEGIRKNEEMLKQQIVSLEDDIIASEKRYETLKSHAEAKIASANAEISKTHQTHEKEVAALRAKLTMTEHSVKNLEISLKQKKEENEELLSICNELIAKMDTK